VPSENGPESDPVVTFLTYFDEDEGLDREAVKQMRNYLAALLAHVITPA
jgi:hypothetical protein